MYVYSQCVTLSTGTVLSSTHTWCPEGVAPKSPLVFCVMRVSTAWVLRPLLLGVTDWAAPRVEQGTCVACTAVTAWAGQLRFFRTHMADTGGDSASRRAPRGPILALPDSVGASCSFGLRVPPRMQAWTPADL